MHEITAEERFCGIMQRFHLQATQQPVPFFKEEMASIRTKPSQGNNRKKQERGMWMIKIFKPGRMSAKPSNPAQFLNAFFSGKWCG